MGSEMRCRGQEARCQRKELSVLSTSQWGRQSIEDQPGGRLRVGMKKGDWWSVVRWNGLGLELDSPFVRVNQPRYIVSFINLHYQKL